jgi:hypothetical protein
VYGTDKYKNNEDGCAYGFAVTHRTFEARETCEAGVGPFIAGWEK